MRTDALTRLTLRQAVPDDAARLAAFARASFVDTFGADNTPADMAMYTASAFGESIQRAELVDSRNTVVVAENDDEFVGYVMLREGAAPDVVGSRDAIEISRLYAGQRYIGAGIGAALMQRSLDLAGSLGREVIWLGVWERNRRAIRFYEQWGFEDVGTQSFVLGHDLQTDRIMMRTVGRIS
jgi:GNAT superfamily N-acetyltransferase